MMKKIYSLFTLVLCILQSYGSENLKPVASLVKYNKSFATYSLFKETKTAVSGTTDIVSHANFVEVNFNELSRLVKEEPQGVVLSFPYQGRSIRVKLVRVNLFTNDFNVMTNQGVHSLNDKGRHYRGIIEGDDHSVASFSFFENELYGIVSSSVDGNIVIGKTKNNPGYIVYSDRNFIIPPGISCSTDDDIQSAGNGNGNTSLTYTTNCVRMYYEIDYDIYQYLGNSVYNVVNYMTWLHNNVATLYYNDSIVTSLSQIYVWTSADPYVGSDRTTQLSLFQATRTSFIGDVAQLIGMDPGSLGGLAGAINGLCSSNNYAYANIQLDLHVVPVYSNIVMVITHEFGHLLGSRHTHACVWNGNNTAIDNCGPTEGYPYEGSCSGAPTPPINGGTIMSYCHLVSAVGTDFANGFGPQPAALIRSIVNGALCLSACNPSCVSAPANDSCSSPVALTINASCNYVNGDLCRATSSISDITCAGVAAPRAYDVWYSVTPTASSVSINCQSGTNTDVVVALYSNVCPSPVAIECADATFMGGLETLNVTGLTPGITYLVRVYDYNGNVSGTDFQICAVDYNCISTNDLCSNAITLSLDTACNLVSGDLCSATQALAPSICSGAQAGSALDVWYKFTPNQTRVIVDCMSGSNTDIVLGFYAGTCASPVFVGCTDASGQGGYEGLDISGLTIGTTFYVRVYDYNGNIAGTDFEICARYDCISSSDVCIASTPLAIDTICSYVSGELCGASQSIPAATCSGFQAPEGRDVWYSLIPTQTGVTITCQSGTTTDVVLGFYSGTCASLALVQCIDQTNAAGLETMNVGGLVPGNNYFVRVYDYNGNLNGTDFQICAVNCNPVTPNVTIAASPSNTICTGTSVTFTASPANGGSSPVYQWKKNGVNSGTGVTYTSSSLANGDVIQCVLTSNAFCANPGNDTSNSVTMIVNPTVTPDVTVAAAPSGAICAGTSVTFTATPANGGASPSYQWKKNGVNAGTGVTYTSSALANGDIIRCVLTSNALCASPGTDTSIAITMIVNPIVTPNVTVAALPSGAICTGASVTFTASPANGGASPSYQWKKNGLNAGTGLTYTSSSLINGDIIQCILTSNAPCVNPGTDTSNAITMIVNPMVTPDVSVSVTPTGTVCSGTNLSFTAAPVNGGASPSYQWKVNGVNVASGAAYSTSSLVDNDIVTCVLSSSAPCLTIATVRDSITMDIETPSSIAGAVVSVGPDTICTQPQQSAALSVIGGVLGTNATWNWYTTCGGTVLNTGIPIVVSPTITTTYYVQAVSSSGVCPNTSCISDSVIVANPADPLISVTGVTMQCTNYTAGLQWYFNGSPLTGDTLSNYTALQNGTYYVVFTDAATGCYAQSASELIQNVGMIGLAESSFSVYPNPANDLLFIKAAGIKNGAYKLNLINMIGQIIKSTSIQVTGNSMFEKMDMKEFSSGIYLLKIESGESKEVIKINKH